MLWQLNAKNYCGGSTRARHQTKTFNLTNNVHQINTNLQEKRGLKIIILVTVSPTALYLIGLVWTNKQNIKETCIKTDCRRSFFLFALLIAKKINSK